MAKSKFLGRYLKKSVAIMLVMLQLIGICLMSVTVNAATTEGSTVSRLINVVYDDAQSMIMGKSTAWSEAKYSLEILSAIMQEKYSMYVYFMSDYKDNGNKKPRLTK